MSVPDLVNLLLAAVSATIFVVLVRRVFFVAPKDHGRDWFGPVDVVTAFSFSLLLGLLAVANFSVPESAINLKMVQGGLVQQLVIGGMILSYLLARRVPLGEFLGWRTRPFWQMAGLGILLILALSPIIMTVSTLMENGAGDDQQVVQFFRNNPGALGRWWVAGLAVIVAPICEELLFRGFFYGVFQRFFGKVPAMFFTSVLFAAIHGHLPTLLPLALLACALTIGLELSGSLLVPMLMHATFNGITLLFLLYYPAT